MKIRKLIIMLILGLCFSIESFAQNCGYENLKVTASTSWTAAFAELAGLDNVQVIAPANLRHPPEYEITVGDVVKVLESDIFIYAGFERMMETLEKSIGNGKLKTVQIKCDNSFETVKESAMKIAAVAGTEKVCEKRIEEYGAVLEEGRKLVKEKGLKGSKVYCHKHQVFLAKELGFEVAGVFGPGPVSAKQISQAKNSNYDFIIDNIHNPVGQPLAEVGKSAIYVVWRNFPEEICNNSLINLVKANIKSVLNSVK